MLNDFPKALRYLAGKSVLLKCVGYLIVAFGLMADVPWAEAFGYFVAVLGFAMGSNCTYSLSRYLRKQNDPSKPHRVLAWMERARQYVADEDPEQEGTARPGVRVGVQ